MRTRLDMSGMADGRWEWEQALPPFGLASFPVPVHGLRPLLVCEYYSVPAAGMRMYSLALKVGT